MIVAIFRPKEYAKETEEKLRKAGFDVVSTPMIELQEKTVRVRDADYTIITSRTSAEIALKKGLIRGRIITIGPKTAEPLKSYNVLIPSKYDSATLYREFADLLKNKRVNLLRSDKGSGILLNLSEICDLREYQLYEIVKIKNDSTRRVVREIAEKRVDAAVFSSRMIVESFMENAEDIGIIKRVVKSLNKIKTIAIGPPTKEKLREYGVEALMPEKYDFDGVIELLSSI